jgi:hypothetical protein
MGLKNHNWHFDDLLHNVAQFDNRRWVEWKLGTNIQCQKKNIRYMGGLSCNDDYVEGAI